MIPEVRHRFFLVPSPAAANRYTLSTLARSIIPSYAIRETYVASSFDAANRRVLGDNIARHARELAVDIVAPSLARVFDAPKWMGTKMKHVIEPRASFRYVSGIEDFSRLVRFDETAPQNCLCVRIEACLVSLNRYLY